MNKTIKVIDLLNKIANGEIKDSTKFKIIPEDGQAFICKYGSGYPGYIWVIDNENEISFNYKIDHMRILGYEVEIIEDKEDINIQDIEEMPNRLLNTEDPIEHIIEQHKKINELVQAVKYLEKTKEDK